MSSARLPLPTNITSAVEGLLNTALTNARCAVADVRAEIAERLALSPAAPEAPADEPGSLTRLTRQDCLRLLAGREVGRLAYIARAGVPDIVPVNYVVDEDGAILVRSGPGPKLQAAERHETVAFEVDDIDPSLRTGWSVVVVGRAEKVPSGVHADPGQPPQPWARGPRCNLVRITPRRIEGRRLS